MNLTYDECVKLTEWLNTLDINSDTIPESVYPILNKLNNVVSKPEQP